MITVTCDMCGEKLNPLNDSIDLEFTFEGLPTLVRCSFNGIKKQLCITCATRLLNWVENPLEKGGAEVKHGEWNSYGDIAYECSLCGKKLVIEQGDADMNYCPNCGAKMDGCK